MKNILLTTLLLLSLSSDLFALGFKETLKMARDGNVYSQALVGEMYRNGDGVKADATQAAYWYRKAAENGLKGAQFNMGLLYVKGEGVEKSTEEASRWFRKAAEQGVTEAQFNLAIIMTESKNPKERKEAVTWFRKSAEKGVKEAQFNLALCLYKGEGVKQDKKEAFKWMRKVADQGVVQAQAFVGRAYQEGEGVKQNPKEAINWYKKAAKQGDDSAMYAVGGMYMFGRGVKKDLTEARKWFIKADKKGNPQAKLAISMLDMGLLDDNLFKNASPFGEASARGNEAEKTANVTDLENGYVRERLVDEVAAAPTVDPNFVPSDPGIQMVSVKGGCLQMGETFFGEPVHDTCVSDFSIGKFEVTQGQWRMIMGNNPSRFSSCGDDCPVEMVSWNDVQEFIAMLNSQSGKSYRLPTEAEWEYAARSGGKREKYSGGDNLDAVAWYEDNSGSKTHPVGQKQPNGLGIFDMSGNVVEWVNDWHDTYSNERQENPQGPSTGSYRVCRGGSWYSVARNVLAERRSEYSPDHSNFYIGFRLASPVQSGRWKIE